MADDDDPGESMPDVDGLNLRPAATRKRDPNSAETNSGAGSRRRTRRGEDVQDGTDSDCDGRLGEGPEHDVRGHGWKFGLEGIFYRRELGDEGSSQRFQFGRRDSGISCNPI